MEAVNPGRLAEACKLLRRSIQDGNRARFLGVIRKLQELGWEAELEVGDELLHAPTDWIAAAGLPLVVVTRTEDGRRERHEIQPDEWPIVEGILDALRVFPGAEVVQIRKKARERFRRGSEP